MSEHVYIYTHILPAGISGRLGGDVGNGAPWDAHEAPNHPRRGRLAPWNSDGTHS